MKHHIANSWHPTQRRAARILSPGMRDNLKYLLAFALGLPLAVAGAAYFIDMFISILLS